jgi:hypothetical protein
MTIGSDAMYVWLKAFHVIAIIAWMAGMLYLPRLFVYHCEAQRDHHAGDGGELGAWSMAGVDGGLLCRRLAAG